MNTQKKILIEQFVDTLPILRAAIGASQADVAAAVGISRQTYCALEQKKRDTSWNKFLSLFLFFGVNEKSQKIMLAKKDFIPTVKRNLIIGTEIKQDCLL